MKKNDKRAVDIGITVITISLLLALGYLYVMCELVNMVGGTWQIRREALGLTAVMISIEVLAVVLTLILRYLIPHLQRRTAALRALGKNSFGKMIKDPTARLAYRGVYAAISEDYYKAEKYLNQTIQQTKVAENQIFGYEWLIHIYENGMEDSKDKLRWCYRKTAELAPDNPRNQCRLANMYYSDGMLDKARDCLQQALRYDPNEGYAYYVLAKIHLIRGEDEQCLETLNKLVKVNESHPLVYGELAMYYAIHGEEELCRENFKKAVLCGIRDGESLERSLDAVMRFNRGETFNGEDLPEEFYRKIEKDTSQTEKD